MINNILSRKNNSKLILLYIGILFISILTSCDRNKFLDYPGIMLALPNDNPRIDTVIWSSTDPYTLLASGADYPSHITNIQAVNTITLEHQTILEEEPGELYITSWSPDGKYVLLSVAYSQSFPHKGLWILDLDDNSKKFLYDTPYDAEWSPQGDMFVYFMREKDRGEYRIHLMNFLTGDDEVIYTIEGYRKDIRGVSWSPDGNKIVFSLGDLDERNQNLYILNLQSGDIQQITYRDINSDPVWSPNGNAIAYKSMDWDDHTISIRLINPEGMCEVKLVDAVGASSIAWSPDGETIAFVAGALYVMNPDDVLGVDFPSEYCKDAPVQ